MLQPIQRYPRKFVAEDLQIQKWADVASYFEKLLEIPIHSVSELEEWLKNRSEIESIVAEDYHWKYIHQSCDTNNPQKEAALSYFLSDIMPEWMSHSNKLNQKVINCPYLEQLDPIRYKIYLRNLRNEVALFREENIALQTKVDQLANEYGKISGAMTIEHEGQTLTLQQAQKLLQSEDRNLRQNIFEKIQSRRLADCERLEELFDKMLKIRHQIAINAGFDNYRDYMMRSLGRFDYGVKDCEDFHQSIAHVITPILKKIYSERVQKLQLTELKPYDLDVPYPNEHPLRPFQNSSELIQKSIESLNEIDTYFGDCISIMQLMKHLDLDSRVGKRPGGYNMPLPEIGVPFIFMNATGTQQDLVTMVHESGHAIHSFLTKDLTYQFDKEFGSEVAELASMSMELLTMDYWHHFYPNPDDLHKAKREQMFRILSILPWIAIVDQFQHWIYTHPNHTREERRATWREIQERYSTGEISWKGYEHFLDFSWHKQLHIFEVPFYYIEYGIAQLGAVGVWKNYKMNAKKAVSDYKSALSLGGKVSIPEVYHTAGIAFDFSEKHIQSLSSLLESEL